MRAGNSKLVIQSLTVRDATGALGAAAGTEAGMILTPWNPDESWTHDALVQVGLSLMQRLLHQSHVIIQGHLMHMPCSSTWQ